MNKQMREALKKAEEALRQMRWSPSKTKPPPGVLKSYDGVAKTPSGEVWICCVLVWRAEDQSLNFNGVVSSFGQGLVINLPREMAEIAVGLAEKPARGAQS